MPQFTRDGAATPLSRTRPRLLSPAAAWYVTDILKDAPPPANARSGRIAYKTGTSYGFRDAWAVGYDGRHVIAVWIGRADGSATPGLSGRTAAAPLLFDAFARIAERVTPLPPAPPGVFRATTATLPLPMRRFGNDSPGEGSAPFAVPAVRIAFPPDRAEIERDDDDGSMVVLKAEGGALPLTWFADGAPIVSDPQRREVTCSARSLHALRSSMRRQDRRRQIRLARGATMLVERCLGADRSAPGVRVRHLLERGTRRQ